MQTNTLPGTPFSHTGVVPLKAVSLVTQRGGRAVLTRGEEKFSTIPSSGVLAGERRRQTLLRRVSVFCLCVPPGEGSHCVCCAGTHEAGSVRVCLKNHCLQAQGFVLRSSLAHFDVRASGGRCADAAFLLAPEEQNACGLRSRCLPADFRSIPHKFPNHSHHALFSRTALRPLFRCRDGRGALMANRLRILLGGEWAPFPIVEEGRLGVGGPCFFCDLRCRNRRWMKFCMALMEMISSCNYQYRRPLQQRVE